MHKKKVAPRHKSFGVPTSAILMLLGLTSVCWSNAIAKSPTTEFNFFHDGEKWYPGWFQCDRTQDVAIFLKPAGSKVQTVLRFSKERASARTMYNLIELGEPDCAMMKCWWNYKRNDSPDTYFVVQESHYYDFAGGYWSRQYQLGEGQTETSPRDKMEECRWFPRLRLAVLTATDSYYITQSAAGKLFLKVFDYTPNNATAPISLIGGTSKFDANRRRETFAFHRGAQNFAFFVGRVRPAVTIELTSGGQVRTPRAVSFTYVQKH